MRTWFEHNFSLPPEFLFNNYSENSQSIIEWFRVTRGKWTHHYSQSMTASRDWWYKNPWPWLSASFQGVCFQLIQKMVICAKEKVCLHPKEKFIRSCEKFSFSPSPPNQQQKSSFPQNGLPKIFRFSLNFPLV